MHGTVHTPTTLILTWLQALYQLLVPLVGHPRGFGHIHAPGGHNVKNAEMVIPTDFCYVCHLVRTGGDFLMEEGMEVGVMLRPAEKGVDQVRAVVSQQ